ncbi:hypothetical protein L210DRAFT_3578958 [Boletus edulis BED1]|uniref:Uncharacterized protein n=1 Tax=Boletus edulis BED1 TaxID=1328754 RepID=A0AAD4BCT6_BOLED|nr:hypothetical protein L210DRAFT_3578958 [Boletus edulis BED1]
MVVPVEDIPNHPQIETNAGSESHVSPNRRDKSPAPSHDKQSLRDLRRIAYASEPLSTQKADPSRPKRAPGHTHNNNRSGKRETGQPNMKLRMNVLLEKIKRDLS